MGANAQTSVPSFTAGEVLSAANMNLSARTGVPVFADSTARDAGFGGTGEKVLAEGQLCYLESTNVVQYYDGSTWATLGPTTSAVIQVKHVEYATETTTTSASLVDTGLTLSITPTSASNKILVFYSQNFFNQSAERFSIALLRGSTNIHQTQGGGTLANVVHHPNAQYLDSPATTSATTYKTQMRKETAGGSALVAQWNATQTGKSTMTLMEVAP